MLIPCPLEKLQKSDLKRSEIENFRTQYKTMKKYIIASLFDTVFLGMFLKLLIGFEIGVKF